jgi:endonuclease YncB( thermonuclease family)
MRRNRKLLLIFLLSPWVISPAQAFSEPPVIGRSTVIDGDTIDIHGERIRINGIDAPESAQLCKNAQGKPYRCGAVAAKALDNILAASRPTRCDFVERDRYRRFVGQCYRADRSNVAALLVRRGWALDWPRYSKGAYADEQNAAKAERLGIWAGEFIPPWEWRKQHKASTQKPTPKAVDGKAVESRLKRLEALRERDSCVHNATSGKVFQSCK